MTGVEVPKYYNPAAINPLRYAEQIKKRQMLWSKKPASAGGEPEQPQVNEPALEAAPAAFVSAAPVSAAHPGGSSFNKWESTNFGNDKTNEKFRRLMGIKSGSSLANEEAPGGSNTSVAPQNTAKWFADQEEQYEKARAFTHTQRGSGLGFSASSGGAPLPRIHPPGIDHVSKK